MAYVEIWVMPVVADRMEDYRKAAEASAAIWLELGALSVTEMVIDDLSPGKTTSFPRAVQLQDGETVVCGQIRFRDRAHRDVVAAASMADGRMEEMMQDVPVDGARMFWTGFEVIVEV